MVGMVVCYYGLQRGPRRRVIVLFCVAELGGGEFWMMSATSTYLVGIKIFVDRNE